jgi:ferrous iron transport protein B
MRLHVQTPAQAPVALTQRLDRVFLHPVWGLPLFLLMMWLVFQAVFTLGKPLQDGLAWLFEVLRSDWLEPAMASWPAALQGLLLDGVYAGVGTVAGFVPLIVLFFVFMSMVEDTGYLSRAAFLMDALMAKLGLDGRSFVMLLMGFGCNVPAIMGTRVIRSRGLRLLTMFTIPFSLCSARLQVFVFFTSMLFSTREAPWVLFSLYLISMLTAMLSALLFQKAVQTREPFVLEMPPYRFPTWRQIVVKGWQEVRHFLQRASRFIVLGVVLVWALTHLPPGVEAASEQSWAGLISQLLAPLTQPLGIDPQLSIALLFGFVAKEIVIGSLAVIYGTQGDALVQAISGHMNWIQGYSFMLFTLIYTPCLSTIATLRNESKSWRFTLASLAWPLALAWTCSFVFYQVASRL